MNLKTNKKESGAEEYVSPKLELTSLNVETGFAASTGDAEIKGFDESYDVTFNY